MDKIKSAKILEQKVYYAYINYELGRIDFKELVDAIKSYLERPTNRFINGLKAKCKHSYVSKNKKKRK